jgi:hypothetical protein
MTTIQFAQVKDNWNSGKHDPLTRSVKLETKRAVEIRLTIGHATDEMKAKRVMKALRHHPGNHALEQKSDTPRSRWSDGHTTTHRTAIDQPS